MCITSDLLKLEKVLSHSRNKKKHVRYISKYIFLFLKKWNVEAITIQNLLTTYYNKLY